MRERFKNMPPHFRTVWRPSYTDTKPLTNLDKNKLKAATKYLTGHCELNYHLNKYKPQNITKIYPHCSMEEETLNRFNTLSDNVRCGLIEEDASSTATTQVFLK